MSLCKIKTFLMTLRLLKEKKSTTFILFAPLHLFNVQNFYYFFFVKNALKPLYKINLLQTPSIDIVKKKCPSIVLLKNSLTRRVQSMSQSYNKQLCTVVTIQNKTKKPSPVIACT